MRVLLFGSRAFRSIDRSFHTKFWNFVTDVIHGWGKPNHCMALYDGVYWLCTIKHGCIRFTATHGPLIEPAVIYEVQVMNPDIGPWVREESLTLPATILDSIGLLPPGIRCTNCVTVTAGLVGIHGRIRTASSLANAIEKVIHASNSRSGIRSVRSDRRGEAGEAVVPAGSRRSD